MVPLFLRALIVEHIYENTIQYMNSLMKPILFIGYEAEIVALLNPDTLEEHFGSMIRENIGVCLGFIKK